jgi:hypothetical protein
MMGGLIDEAEKNHSYPASLRDRCTAKAWATRQALILQVYSPRKFIRYLMETEVMEGWNRDNMPEMEV